MSNRSNVDTVKDLYGRVRAEVPCQKYGDGPSSLRGWLTSW